MSELLWEPGQLTVSSKDRTFTAALGMGQTGSAETNVHHETGPQNPRGSGQDSLASNLPSQAQAWQNTVPVEPLQVHIPQSPSPCHSSALDIILERDAVHPDPLLACLFLSSHLKPILLSSGWGLGSLKPFAV